MDSLKTVEESLNLDSLNSKKREDVAKMRTSLLACNADPSIAKFALKNIAILRMYHQVAKIINYLDLMDKLEEKLYSSVEHTIDNMDPNNQSTWMMLLNVQERLQKNMIESNKLLQPFLDMQNIDITEVTTEYSAPTPSTLALDANTREKIRNSAQAVLLELNAG